MPEAPDYAAVLGGIHVRRCALLEQLKLKLYGSGARIAGSHPCCGGYDPGYPWQTTWAVPLGATQPTR